MRVLDLFSGIGGFSLAADSLGMETIAFCECEKYPVTVLNRHWPDVPVFPDVKELTADALAHTTQRQDDRRVVGDVVSEATARGGGDSTAQSRREDDIRGGSDALAHADAGRRQLLTVHRPAAGSVDRVGATEQRQEPSDICTGDSYADDTVAEKEIGNGLILTAGFPCQDLSYAGAGAGLDGDTRSGLYREVIRLVREVRPDFVLLENVAAILTRGVGRVLADLAESGYGWAYCCVPACAVGAPHRRDRWWCVAWPTLGDEADKARGERIVTSVLRGLTPFGSDTWTTPIANEAEKRGNHHEGLRGQVANAASAGLEGE